MAKKKVEKSLKEQSVQDLQKLVDDTNEELFRMKNELKASKKVEKPHLFRQKRKLRARALTFITQKMRQKESHAKSNA